MVNARTAAAAGSDDGPVAASRSAPEHRPDDADTRATLLVELERELLGAEPAADTRALLLIDLERELLGADPAPDLQTPSGPPRLAAGVEPIGRFDGPGTYEQPFLVRLASGRVAAVSELLYAIVATIDGTRTTAQIAELVSARQPLRLSDSDVAYVLERKLRPLGMLADKDLRADAWRAPPDSLLALRFRVAILPARVVGAIGALLAPLFWPVVVVLVVGGLAAVDAWIAIARPIDRSVVLTLLEQPSLLLALAGIGWLSVAFHEFGHAAACRYGGASPGRMGIGLYIVWPVLYTDVAASYELPRGARLRIDLGGVYFNAIFALALAGVYALTGFAPLVLAIIAQQGLVLTQFLPWLRLDGYWVVSDLIGVPDLFARIGPTLRSLVPGAETPDEVAQLRPWARAVVGLWVGTAVLALGAALGAAVYFAPRAIDAFDAAFDLQRLLLDAARARGDEVDVASAALGLAMLAAPIAALALTTLLATVRVGRWGWRRAGLEGWMDRRCESV